MDRAYLYVTKELSYTLLFAVLGCIIGSGLGILFGALFAELFREILSENNPGWNLSAQVENLGVELYSYLFVGLGWVGGFIVGGVTGLFVRSLVR